MHATVISHLLLLNFITVLIFVGGNIMKLLIMQLAPISSYFLIPMKI
jgi:hypothetical protein